MKTGIVEDEIWHSKDTRIIWEEGEFEESQEDVRKNYNDLTKLKPKNALNLLKLFAIQMIEIKDGMGSILRDEERELYVRVFGGTHAYERGCILLDLLNAIKLES